jgi:hypothetical protein
MAGMNPALVIGRQSAAGNDCVDMVMGQQVGSPCVQDASRTELELPEQVGLLAAQMIRTELVRRLVKVLCERLDGRR